MGFKDILAIIDATTGGDHVVRFAEQMAQQSSVHLSGLVLGWRPSIPTISEAWVVAERIEALMRETKATLDADVEVVRSRLARNLGAGSVEGLLLNIDEARKLIGVRARHADVAIVSQATQTAADTANVVLETCLFVSGRPVIVVPPTWNTGPIGRTILVGWKPTREAARALADASALVDVASRVVVATVDAVPSDGAYGETPGADICTHLARRGAKVELANLASGGRSQAQTLQDHAREVGADLMVMGGYGRSPVNELILGGVTREALHRFSLPVLMSH